MKKIVLTALGMVLATASLNANAAKASGTVSAQVVLAAGCTVDVNNVDFFYSTPMVVGAPAQTNMDSGSIVVSCSTGTAYRVGINAGLNVAGASRNMRNAGVNNIPYSIFTGGVPLGDIGLNAVDASYVETTAAIGSPAATASFTSTGAAPRLIPLTMNLDTSATTIAGTYTDTLIVTVAW